jgi:uncharacterized protein YsxB (DUF464 family)
LIRVYSVEDSLDDEGGWTVVVTGHGNAETCAGVSAILSAAVDGLARIAKEYPRQVRFQRLKVEKPKKVR